MRAKELRRILRYRVASLLPELLKAVPVSWAHAFGACMGWCAYWTIPRDRRRARHNLSLVYPQASPKAVASMAKRGLRELGRNISDFVRFPKLSAEEREALVEFEGVERLEAVVGEGHGAIVVTGHLGCWELIGAALNAKGIAVKGIARALREKRLETLLQQHRSSMGVETIDSGAPLEALRHLKSGGVLAVLVDQRVPRGIWVEFLGQQTLVADGAARLALAAKAPLVPLTIGRSGRKHRIQVGRVIEPPKTRDDIPAVTQQVATEIARRILENPMEWMWIHPRWENVA